MEREILDRPQRVANFDLSATKKRLKLLPIVLFRRLRKMFLHNSFSHKRLEQNEASLPHANFGFWVKPRAQRITKGATGPRNLSEEIPTALDFNGARVVRSTRQQA